MTTTDPRPNLPTPVSRRRFLALIGAGSAGTILIGRSALAQTSDSSVTDLTIVAPTVPADVTATPMETGGPFPSDGSNDNGEGTVANVLADARAVRSDIRSDLDGTNTQEGIPMTLQMLIADATGAALPNHAVYVWHCNRDGAYSQYNSPMLGGDYTDRSWLRGVQITDANGLVTFHTILPGRYQGRAFHVHFEVYADAAYSTKMLTSQMGMDDATIDTLYAQAAGYEQSLRNDTNNSQDNIFRDGVDHQLLTVSGDVTAGLVATFTAIV